MTAALPEVEPAEVTETGAGEWHVRFPVLVIEGLDTSDGRFIEAGALTHRALPLSLLAQPESAHGGDEPGPAILVGRIDTMQRVPGPEVISRRTGEPFPEGTFVWQATGALDPTIVVNERGTTIGDLVRPRYLRGVSVDLAGMDYEIAGEDGFEIDPDNPRRQLVTYGAEVAAATLVPIPAFGDAYMEIKGDDAAFAPVTAEELPEGLMASAVPAWRSSEVGDECGLCLAGLVAAAAEGMPVRIPPDAVEQITAVIDTGEERDAEQLATAIVEHIAVNWALTEPVSEDELPSDDDALAIDDTVVDEDAGLPEVPQPCQFGPEDAVESIVFRDGDAYVPVCAEHRQQALDELAAAGEVVDESVPIERPGTVTAAADEPHTGGMIALVPADPGALVVEGGDPSEQLHLTLAYLGEDVTGWSVEQRAEVLDAVRRLAAATPPVEAEIMGHAAFNPTGANDREPCAVYLVSGEMLPALKGEAAAFDVSEHPVFLPHVTAGYGLDPSALSYVGPVVFDRLRVALADEVTDIPLGESRVDDPDEDEPGQDEPVEPVVAAAAAPDEAVAEVSEEVGMPDAPQPCEYGDHPAVRSLLFRGGEAYVPVCDEHEPEARERLAADGDEVAGIVDIEQPDDEDEDEDDTEDEVVVAGGAVRPPAAWFADPQLDGPTPLTVDEDGRIRGHAATWNACHIGFPQQCVTAPRSTSGYAYFTTGAVLTDDGQQVPVGSITMDTGHAPTSMSRQAAAAHYDHTGAAVADVAVGEDAHGIWVAGALRASVDEHTAARLRASALSGDWRRVGGGLELVALLAVNVPGFPIPRARVASGEPLALVAAGALPSSTTAAQGLAIDNELTRSIDVGKVQSLAAVDPGRVDLTSLADAIAERLEQRQQAGQLSTRHAALLAQLDDTPDRAAALLAELDDSPQRAAQLLAALDDEDDDYASQMPAQLRESYLRGEVAARIAWGTPGDMTRCMAQARGHGVPERMVGGMCAQLHREAVGFWPGDRRNR
jgi:2'-5' RNA ligase